MNFHNIFLVALSTFMFANSCYQAYVNKYKFWGQGYDVREVGMARSAWSSGVASGVAPAHQAAPCSARVAQSSALPFVVQLMLPLQQRPGDISCGRQRR